MIRILVTALTIFVLDQASKYYVMQVLDLPMTRVIDIASPYLTFVMAWNTGINFGLFGDADMKWLLIALSIVVSVALFFWARSKPGKTQFWTGLIIGGALGNAVDRWLYGAVADFLNMSCCGIDNPYVFNVADIAIFAGAAGLILLPGTTPRKRRKAA
ncbi:signal peptidase II [Paracoccaceae bacterium GXU_MW_L88]